MKFRRISFSFRQSTQFDRFLTSVSIAGDVQNERHEILVREHDDSCVRFASLETELGQDRPKIHAFHVQNREIKRLKDLNDEHQAAAQAVGDVVLLIVLVLV
jgi:hypothetical protein